MTDYDADLLPVEEKSVCCHLCGEELYDYQEIENEECKSCEKEEIKEQKIYRLFCKKNSNKEGKL